MIRKILPSKDPRLNGLSKPVKVIDKKVLTLAKDLVDTLKVQKEPEGVGLAACQIGVLLQVFAMVQADKIRVIINPEVLEVKNVKKTTKTGKTKIKESDILEGCLSLPNYYGPLKRPNFIKIKFLNLKGEEVTEIFRGFQAQIVQHELDHLKGVLFLRRIFEQKKPLYKLKGDEFEEVEL
jgi:peptide deformylase